MGLSWGGGGESRITKGSIVNQGRRIPENFSKGELVGEGSHKMDYESPAGRWEESCPQKRSTRVTVGVSTPTGIVDYRCKGSEKG